MLEHPRLEQSVNRIIAALGQPRDHEGRAKVTAIVKADFDLGSSLKAQQIRNAIGASSAYEVSED